MKALVIISILLAAMCAALVAIILKVAKRADANQERAIRAEERAAESDAKWNGLKNYHSATLQENARLQQQLADFPARGKNGQFTPRSNSKHKKSSKNT